MNRHLKVNILLMDSFSQSIQPLFRTIARFGWPVVVVEKILNDPSCTNTLFQDNFLDQTCLSLAISKTLGYVTIIGALMYKMPIIINILKQKSGAGLNVTSVYLETTAFLGLVAYNFKRNNEFSTYGDNISASIQSIVIIILMWAYGMGSKSKFSMAHILVVLGLGGAYCFSLVSAQEQHHAYIVSYAMGISTVSKVPQIIDNFKTGELGAQSRWEFTFQMCTTV